MVTENRAEKLIEIIRKAAAEFMQKESNGASLITITGVKLSTDEKNATVLFTVLPVEKESAALEFSKRMRSEFKQYVKENTKIGRIPMFDFQIDLGEKHRQKIDLIPLK